MFGFGKKKIDEASKKENVFGSVSINYNDEFGYIFAPYARISNSVAKKSFDYVKVGISEVSNEFVGNMIFELLEKSRNAEPIEPKNIDENELNRVGEVKSVKQFSRKFQDINVDENEEFLIITKYLAEVGGGCTTSGNNDVKEVPKTISNEELGKIIAELFSYKEEIEYPIEAEFETLSNVVISYSIPSDEFDDIGDGGTDAYQIYECGKNIFAFIIDSGYTDFTKETIEERWNQMYSGLTEFTYNEVVENNLRIVIKGRTVEKEIVSYIFDTGEDMLEVIYEVDLKDVLAENQEEVRKEFERVVKSIKIG